MLNNFSPNMLKTYQSCPKKYYFQYVEGVNAPKASTPFEKGKKIHALANYNLQKINIEKLEKTLNTDETKTWIKLKENEYYQKEVVKSEFPIMCKIDKYWIGGRIDAIVHDANKYYILDYKTGSVPQNPEFDYQTIVYLLCVDKYLKNYDSLSFVYIDLKNNKNCIVEFTEGKKVQYEEKIIKICESITKDSIYKYNAQDCKYCEYAKICTK